MQKENTYITAYKNYIYITENKTVLKQQLDSIPFKQVNEYIFFFLKYMFV